MRKNSIRKQLMITLIWIVVLPLIVVGVVISIINYIEERKNLIEYQELAIALATQTLSMFMYEQEQRIHSFLELNNLMEMAVKQQSDALSLFSTEDLTKGYSFENVSLVNAKGKVLVFYSQTQNRAASRIPDLTNTNEFLIPLYTGKAYYRPVSFYETRTKPLIKISVPIKDIRTRVFQGVLILDMNLMPMREKISDIGIGRNGVVYLIDSSGRILAHPDPSLVYGNIKAGHSGRSEFINGAQGEGAFVSAGSIPFGGNGSTLSVVIENQVREVYSYMYISMVIIGIIVILSLMWAISSGFIIIRKVIEPIKLPPDIAKKIEEQAKIQAEQMVQKNRQAYLGALVTGIAHEINNPNQSILNNGLFLKDSWQSIKTVLNRYYNENGDFLVGGVEYSEFRKLAESSYEGIPASARKIASIIAELKKLPYRKQKNP